MILVYEPARRRAAKMRLPAEVEVRGQVLELQGKASRSMVRLGNEQVEAKVGWTFTNEETRREFAAPACPPDL